MLGRNVQSHWIKNMVESKKHLRRVYGVDFSGAENAGKRIWIAGGVLKDDFLTIEKCFQAETLAGAGEGRKGYLAALRRLMEKEKNCAFGLDFPFGLPLELVCERSWEDFVLGFPEQYLSPEGFRTDCRRAASNRELKRITDLESRTPFSPYNLRVYRQTYYGIRDILSPLVHDSSACILPMQKALPDRPWILEICPASMLKRIMKIKQLPPYKGSADRHRAARMQILDLLDKNSLLKLEDTVRASAVRDKGGDALDSVIAAFATYRALLKPAALSGSAHRAYLLEGYVFC